MFNYLFNIVAYFFILWMKLTSFYNMSVFISKIPFSFGNTIRYFFYKNTLKNVGTNVVFPYGIIFSHKDISIGNNVRFGPYNTIGLVDFGDDIIIAQYVHFLSGNKQHGYDKKDIPMINQIGTIKRIKIEKDIWIGTNSIIMNDITKGCIIASGSIVTKSFDEYSIIGGNPAKVIKKR
jgi:virginiamycin A acetyltransferase